MKASDYLELINKGNVKFLLENGNYIIVNPDNCYTVFGDYFIKILHESIGKTDEERNSYLAHALSFIPTGLTVTTL